MPKNRQTCTECSMRRQKCDREQPCGRCVKRGQADKCTTDWGPDGYDARRHRVYPRIETKVDEESHDAPPTSATRTAGERHSVSNGHGFTPDSNASGATPSYHAPTSHASMASPHQIQPPPTLANQTPARGTIDFMSFGKVQLAEYDPRLKSVLLEDPYTQNGLRERRDEFDMLAPAFGGTGPAQLSFLQLLLPSNRQIFQLVEYNIEQLLWYHACFHGPTFHAELTSATAGRAQLQINENDLRWTAVLFSIMASSMFSVSDGVASSWGFQRDERAKLTRQWFMGCVTCLNLADYMRCQHIWSVQAIAMLTQSAHVLGFSNTQSALLGCAMKIGQGLGLHKLGLEDDETSFSVRTGTLMVPAQQQKIVQREIGRRVWGQLCIQDWFSIPFCEMYCLNPLHFQTIKPRNIDEVSLQILPTEEPTIVGFPNFLYDVARLMPEGHDALLANNTLYTKYERVLEWDAKLRQLVTEQVPKYLNVLEPIEPSWPPWVLWARRSTMVCYHHKIIMIHRPFLGRSFTEPTFAFSRRACVAAAKILLKEAKQAYDDEGPSLWIDQAFSIAAGITLALDLFHRRSGEPELEEHRKLVETTINMLGKYDSMIGVRGCRMLASLLAEQAKVCASIQLGNAQKHDLDGDEPESVKRQKFDMPRFVEHFVGEDGSFTGNLGAHQDNRSAITSRNEPKAKSGANATDKVNDPIDPMLDDNAFSYERFEQLFPPQAGISNSFLFEDLLNFDI